MHGPTGGHRAAVFALSAFLALGLTACKHAGAAAPAPPAPAAPTVATAPPVIQCMDQVCGPMPTAPAPVEPAPGADFHSWAVQPTTWTCTPDSAGGVQVSATVHVLMAAANHGAWPGDEYASNLRVEARLENTGNSGADPLGLRQLGEEWRTVRFPDPAAVPDELLQDTSYSQILSVTTDGNAVDHDVVVHIKAIWDRKVPLADLVEESSEPFPTCPGGTVYS